MPNKKKDLNPRGSRCEGRVFGMVLSLILILILNLSAGRTVLGKTVYGDSSSESRAGVTGVNDAVSGRTRGVVGFSRSPEGIAVEGQATATSGESVGVRGISNSTSGTGVTGVSTAETGETYGVLGISESSFGIGVEGKATATSGQTIGVFGRSDSPEGVGGRFFNKSTGDIIQGLGSSRSRSSVIVLQVTNSGIVRSRGGFETLPDFAESIEARGSTEDYEPGDVLVINRGKNRSVEKSSSPYSTLVAGVYSANPGVLGVNKPMESRKDSEIPMAIVGIVPCKVSTENGAIQVGDLLTTSSIPGHAMKAKALEINGVKIQPAGTILGKALEPFEEGEGKIKVLLTLQ